MTSSAFHGLAAFRGTRNALMQRQAARACIGAEVCVADRPIGPVGLCLSGPILYAFRGDCWSRLTSRGERWTENSHQHALTDPTEAEYYALCRNHVSDLPETTRAYCEAWMVPDGIDYVWVKDWADAQTKRNARFMAKIFRVPCVVVTGQTRVWKTHDPAPWWADDEELVA